MTRIHKSQGTSHTKPVHFPKAVKLTAARKAEILSTYQALQTAGRIEDKRIAAMPIGEQFLRIPVKQGFQSASFGHSTTILVPEGALSPSVKADPNKAKEFYVQYGPSTNRPGGIYGPFHIK